MRDPDRSTSVTAPVRRFPRSHIEAPVLVLVGSPRLPDVTLDLSEGGLCVWTELPLRAGTLSGVRLGLPGSAVPVTTQVRVAWSDEDTMGLQFLAPTREVLTEVRRALGHRS
jgi:PilZ domain